jgi:hypothetical protein
MAEVMTSAINVRGTGKETVLSKIKKNTNAPKTRLESTVVVRACPPLAPTARAASERLAPAKSIAFTRPNQKNVVAKDELIQTM